MASIKEFAVGTPLGRAALSARDYMAVMTAPREQVATLLNDQLATRLALRVCRDTFVDVGAHIGSVMGGYRGKVIGIEAIPAKARTLQRKFPNAVVHSCAVGETDGEVTFFVHRTLSGYSSLVNLKDAEQITVPLHRLDSIVSDADVIKIDVEGAELGVLRGAENLIHSCRSVIMFESAPGEPMYSKADIWQWFADHRYIVLVPDRVPHNGPGLSAEGFAESHGYPRRTTNYFGVPVERRDQIKDRAR